MMHRCCRLIMFFAAGTRNATHAMRRLAHYLHAQRARIAERVQLCHSDGTRALVPPTGQPIWSRCGSDSRTRPLSARHERGDIGRSSSGIATSIGAAGEPRARRLRQGGTPGDPPMGSHGYVRCPHAADGDNQVGYSGLAVGYGDPLLGWVCCYPL